jgi:hypothetical protein
MRQEKDLLRIAARIGEGSIEITRAQRQNSRNYAASRSLALGERNAVRAEYGSTIFGNES